MRLFMQQGTLMWDYPQFDPVAISLGPVSIHWYAISYLVGIGLAWWLLVSKSRRKKLGWSDEAISDVVFYAVLGIILGGRIGYMLFYGHAQIAADPLVIFKTWQGGMSFHGGMIGVFLSLWIYGRKYQRSFFEVTDFIAPSIPVGLGCGRIGNFINGELPGRVTDVPWAAIYPGEAIGRHPSSLYQALLEGPVLFAILWVFASRPRPVMAVSGLFLVGYGSLRFFSEFFREPDSHMGFVVFNWMTQGQLLSTPMILFGVGFLVFSYRERKI
jgi:phosphatidylglycerol---prolipoprotein diacylglyceryl transferase